MEIARPATDREILYFSIRSKAMRDYVRVVFILFQLGFFLIQPYIELSLALFVFYNVKIVYQYGWQYVAEDVVCFPDTKIFRKAISTTVFIRFPIISLKTTPIFIYNNHVSNFINQILFAHPYYNL